MPIISGPILETPRAVIFDVGRVIIPVHMNRALEVLTNRVGLSHEHVLRELEADPRWLDWQEGRMGPGDWHKHLSDKFKLSFTFEEFCGVWNSMLDPGTILPELLFERLAVNCRIGLLSNTDPIHVAHIEATYAFVRHFPVRVYSCRVGASKPLPVIFHHALREIDALPRETLFVDDLRENASAAASLGINAFHFTTPDELLSELTRWELW